MLEVVKNVYAHKLQWASRETELAQGQAILQERVAAVAEQRARMAERSLEKCQQLALIDRIQAELSEKGSEHQCAIFEQGLEQAQSGLAGST